MWPARWPTGPSGLPLCRPKPPHPAPSIGAGHPRIFVVRTHFDHVVRTHFDHVGLGGRTGDSAPSRRMVPGARAGLDRRACAPQRARGLGHSVFGRSPSTVVRRPGSLAGLARSLRSSSVPWRTVQRGRGPPCVLTIEAWTPDFWHTPILGGSWQTDRKVNAMRGRPCGIAGAGHAAALGGGCWLSSVSRRQAACWLKRSPTR